MKRALLPALVLAVAVLLGACSSANGETTESTSTSRAATKGESAQQPLGAISITNKGFVPSWPIVPLNQRVTFTNETDTPQQIVFENERDAAGAFVQSPVIPPGGTWEYTATTFTSLAYHSPNLPGAAGRIQVDPPAEP